MSCQKCCFYPCDQTSICMEGTYWIRRGNKLTKMVEMPPAVQKMITRAVLKALEEEV